MRAFLLVVTVLMTVLLAGCGTGERPLGSGPEPAPSQPNEGAGAAPALVPERTRNGTAQADRQEITTGQLHLTADNPIAVGKQVVELVESAGGRVDDMTERPETDNQPPSSSLTVRVPADTLTQTLDKLHGLGEVTNLSISRNDVTMQVQDLEARIGALRTSIARLQALISSAASTADLIAAEKALADRQGELDSLTARQRYLADQVELATLMVEITTDRPESRSGPDNFWEGVVSGWNVLLAALSAAVVFAGAAIPWLVFLALLVAIVVVAVRLVRRRKRRA